MIRFRASSVGNLLVGGNAITDKQLKRLEELQTRADDPNQKDLTERMESELQGLIEKRDSDFEFGTTAKNYIIDCWLENEFGASEPVLTPEMQKGMICELEALDLLSRQLPGGFRVKNDERKTNEWFTGECDTIAGDWIEDVKCSWNLRTFVKVQRPDPLYYAQGQVYMDLWDKPYFRVVHVLLDTPDRYLGDLLDEERRRIVFKLPGGEDHPAYPIYEKQLHNLHKVSHIDESKRIKVFEFQRDDKYLDTLKLRVEQAQDVYRGMKL